MHAIAVLALPGVVAFDLATPPQVFGSVPGRRYAVTVCGDPVRAAQGFEIVPAVGWEAAAAADTVIVPGIADESAPLPGPVLEVLRAAAARGARVASICTGAFLLAEAGLLDGRRATTHWASIDALRRRFPRVRVEPDVLWVDEGDVVTSAGVAAGLDLCLHLVRRDHGAEAANAAARRVVVAPHRAGGQAQFIDAPVPRDEGGSLEPTRAWALERLHESLTVERLAGHAGHPPRTFARRFRAETGTTPLQWLLHQRVLLARHLLECTDAPVEVVARRTGFGSAVGLREHFRRATHTTPSAYRAAFRAAR